MRQSAASASDAPLLTLPSLLPLRVLLSYWVKHYINDRALSPDFIPPDEDVWRNARQGNHRAETPSLVTGIYHSSLHQIEGKNIHSIQSTYTMTTSAIVRYRCNYILAGQIMMQ
ncbi:hypothetical protein GDO81_024831 [Engystomops pustulosus]|uniref:Uncharacterized protein n=1 Tax=Engystomops pustulosus TaxID=76066 RepID=A0AAV6Z312_ENGPU|nr:hypothetical protein GDO81_024831 [Engystomops pustulosus]